MGGQPLAVVSGVCGRPCHGPALPPPPGACLRDTAWVLAEWDAGAPPGSRLRPCHQAPGVRPDRTKEPAKARGLLFCTPKGCVHSRGQRGAREWSCLVPANPGLRDRSDTLTGTTHLHVRAPHRPWVRSSVPRASLTACHSAQMQGGTEAPRCGAPRAPSIHEGPRLGLTVCPPLGERLACVGELTQRFLTACPHCNRQDRE